MTSMSSHPHPAAAAAGRTPELRWLRGVPVMALLLASAASVALLFLPFYGNVGVGAESTGTATLIEVNGSGVVILLALPVLITAVIAVVRGRRAVLVSALCTGLLAVLVLLGIASIGLFYLPRWSLLPSE
ncbi:MAG TPA: hypothetical protein H9815_16500 [Candidatus Ruania gallistercoris]|uniref:Uncharacterized protein n=1 Tax=Candidatus Ruania gallistercoris TaxID=2838746 RepID=A0A9D2EGL1_9MICO|nr:hypothetical protein [Candidatus Ruania gallistercoris]